MTYDFMNQHAASASQANQRGGGVQGSAFQFVGDVVPATKEATGTPFCFWILPSFEAIHSGTNDLTKGAAIFTANVHFRIAGTNQCVYSPTVRFPGEAQPRVQDLIGPHLESIRHQNASPSDERACLRWAKDVELTEGEKGYRKAFRESTKVLMQVCLLNQDGSIRVDDAGEPMVVLFSPAASKFNEWGWQGVLEQLAGGQIGGNPVAPVDVRAGCMLSGTRMGAGGLQTSYLSNGPFYQGTPYAIARLEDNATPDEAMISRILSKVLPWDQVFKIMSEEEQQKLISDFSNGAGRELLYGAQPHQPTPQNAVPGAVDAQGIPYPTPGLQQATVMPQQPVAQPMHQQAPVAQPPGQGAPAAPATYTPPPAPGVPDGAIPGGGAAPAPLPNPAQPPMTAPAPAAPAGVPPMPGAAAPAATPAMPPMPGAATPAPAMPPGTPGAVPPGFPGAQPGTATPPGAGSPPLS